MIKSPYHGNIVFDFISPIHWNFFLLLEENLLEIGRYIDINTDHFHVYSTEITKLFLSAAAEFDVISKRYCKLRGLSAKLNKSLPNRLQLLSEMRSFSQAVYIYPFNLEIHPFSDWNNLQTPEWWKAYNRVKHHRDKSYKDANIKNCIESMAGLFLVLLEIYGLSAGNLEGKGINHSYPEIEMVLQTLLIDSRLFRLGYDFYRT